MKTLCLPLTKRWYEMIESGVKGAEYRAISEHWIPRLLEFHDGTNLPRSVSRLFACHHDILGLRLGQGVIVFKKIAHVKFSYGYTKRTMTFELDSIRIGKGIPDWGAPLGDVFIIKLGKRI